MTEEWLPSCSISTSGIRIKQFIDRELINTFLVRFNLLKFTHYAIVKNCSLLTVIFSTFIYCNCNYHTCTFPSTSFKIIFNYWCTLSCADQ